MEKFSTSESLFFRTLLIVIEFIKGVITMDFQDAPNIVFDKQWEKDQKQLAKIVQHSDKQVQKRINKLKRDGYSEEEY